MYVTRALASIATVLVAACSGSRCPGCGRPTMHQPCRRCDRELRAQPACQDAIWVDDGVAARLVRRAKLGHWRGARVLADYAAGRLARPDVDLVTWVPASRRRRARRGGCLPESVARDLGRRWGIEVRSLLVRAAGHSQRGLGRADRRRNVAEAYRLAPGVKALVRGRRVLVVDDVRTTGATLEAAAQQLRRAGACARGLALAGVEHEPGGGPARTSRMRGVGTPGIDSRGIAATSAEFPLTIGQNDADTVEHVQ